MRQEDELQGQPDGIGAPESTGISSWLTLAIVICAAAALLFPFYS